MEKGTSYFGVRDVRHARRDLDRFRQRGLDAVLHTFSERDRLYYQDTMAELVDASHERGFQVYVNPWGVGGTFGGEALSAFVARHPGARQQLSGGQRVPAACFNHPSYRSFLREWTVDAVDLGADVIFWDEPHWTVPGAHGNDVGPDTWSCRCPACREAFRETHGVPMPEADTEAVRSFRETSLLDFLDEMMAIAREGGAKNAVCVLPFLEDHSISDWDRLAGRPDLDVLATDPYWGFTDEDPGDFVGRHAARAVDTARRHDLASQLWIQGFWLDGNPETIETVRTATRTVLEHGPDSIFLWGWDGCRVISEIACEDPGAVWEAYLAELP